MRVDISDFSSIFTGFGSRYNPFEFDNKPKIGWKVILNSGWKFEYNFGLGCKLVGTFLNFFYLNPPSLKYSTKLIVKSEPTN